MPQLAQLGFGVCGAGPCVDHVWSTKGPLFFAGSVIGGMGISILSAYDLVFVNTSCIFLKIYTGMANLSFDYAN